MILADLGADVIKVEKPDGGDDQRRMGPAYSGTDAVAFHDVNRGKRAVTIDIKSEAGRADLDHLAATADVLIHNLRPGVAEQFGIDGAAMCAKHPRLIYCSVSGFGNTGPMRLQPAFEPIAQAFSGIMSVNGDAEGPPSRVGFSVVDYGTGMWCVIAILTALHRRNTTGAGGVIDTSLLETAITWESPHISGLLNLGRTPKRQGTAHPTMVPYQAFETADAPMMIAAGNDRLFGKLARVLGKPEWIAEARFATNRDRHTNRETLVPLVMEITRTRTRAEWLIDLEAAGVPCTPINTIADALASPQVEALGQQVTGVNGEKIVFSALPISFDGVRPPITSLAPKLGEHNRELLGRPNATPE